MQSHYEELQEPFDQSVTICIQRSLLIAADVLALTPGNGRRSTILRNLFCPVRCQAAIEQAARSPQFRVYRGRGRLAGFSPPHLFLTAPGEL